MPLVELQEFRSTAWMISDDLASPEDLDPSGKPTNLHLLANETEGDAVSSSFKADGAIVVDGSADGDIERLRQCFWHSRQ